MGKCIRTECTQVVGQGPWGRSREGRVGLLKEHRISGVPVEAQRLMNPTSIREDTGSIPGLAQWAQDPGIAVSCGVGRRCSNSTPSLGTSMCPRCGPKKDQKKKVPSGVIKC